MERPLPSTETPLPKGGWWTPLGFRCPQLQEWWDGMGFTLSPGPLRHFLLPRPHWRHHCPNHRTLEDQKREPLTHERKPNKDFKLDFLSDHDWLRALRMASYGFLLYGPGSYAWYQLLDHYMPKQTLTTLSSKVILNQIILGPSVIAVVFAWNSLWLGKLSELPIKYQKDALPTLLNGFKFWIPASILNFGVVPLQARVAFMSACSIFWNFYLSTTMSKRT